MRRVIDKDGRIMYKYNHSVSKGGNVYIHKAKIIDNKQGLRNVLNAISNKYGLVDACIKIYEDIFFYFFHIPNSLAPAELIENIRKNIITFANWNEEYVFTGVHDLQEIFLKKDLEKWGYNYDKE